METKTIARVNQTDIIVLVEDVRKKIVPISPICAALGIDSKAQRNRIERDEILSKVKVMTTSTEFVRQQPRSLRPRSTLR